MYTDFPNEESQQLLANVSTTQNGSFQMQMEHDQDDKLWRGSSQFGSFVVTPVGGQNHPVITDFVAQEYYYYPKAANEEACEASKKLKPPYWTPKSESQNEMSD